VAKKQFVFNSSNNAFYTQLAVYKPVLNTKALLFLHFLMILLLLHSFLFSFADDIGDSLS